MSDRIIFRAMLSEIKELAEENGNRLTREQIRDFFRESNLTQEQLEMVTAYLAGEKIQIEGYEKKQEAADTVLDGEQSQSPESDWNQRQNTGAAGPGEEEKKETMVYVTENGSVYHKSMGCSYLDLSTSQVSKSAVPGLRNQYGEKYTPCETCSKNAEEAGMVYITETGNRYHTLESCSGLKRTVRMVKQSHVSGKMHVCSRCG